MALNKIGEMCCVILELNHRNIKYVSYGEFLDNWMWADGTPCGVKEAKE